MEPGFIILLVLVVPFVLLWPLLIWAGAITSLYAMLRSRLGRKAAEPRKTVPGKISGE
jgi:hypothetical protein